MEPSIQAAFVDFGVGRNGFLHISDVESQYFRQGGYDPETPIDPKSGPPQREKQTPRSEPASSFGEGLDLDVSDDDSEGGGVATRSRTRSRDRVRPGARPRVKPPIQEIFRRGDESHCPGH